MSQIRASQIRASQIRATEISSNHGELHGAIFLTLSVPYFECLLRVCLFVSGCDNSEWPKDIRYLFLSCSQSTGMLGASKLSCKFSLQGVLLSLFFWKLNQRCEIFSRFWVNRVLGSTYLQPDVLRCIVWSCVSAVSCTPSQKWLQVQSLKTWNMLPGRWFCVQTHFLGQSIAHAARELCLSIFCGLLLFCSTSRQWVSNFFTFTMLKAPCLFSDNDNMSGEIV